MDLTFHFFWNCALILLLYFIFNIVLPDGMNHPSLCIFFFLWCYLTCEQLDARTLQKYDKWRVRNCAKFLSIVRLFYVGCRLRIKVCEVFFVHNCVKFLSIVPLFYVGCRLRIKVCEVLFVHNCVKFLSIVRLFYVGCRLRIKVCEVFFVHTRTSIHYDSLGVHKSVNSVRTDLLSWVDSWAPSMQKLGLMVLFSQVCVNQIASKCLG
jgi:hypothetical protein